MQIVYHVGAHGSDHDRLVRTLLRNREELWTRGTEIPAPNRYRGVFGSAINSLNGGIAPPEMQDMLLDALIDNDSAQRVVLSQSAFLGIPQRAVSEAGLYPRGAHRLLGLSNLFPDRVVEFFLAVVHPATQVAALVAMNGGDYDGVMGGIDPRRLRWAPTIRAMQAAVPDRDFVIWAQEDLPFVWPEVLRRMAGVPADMPMRGDDAVLSQLLPPEALRDVLAQIAELPAQDIRARRALVERALSASGSAAAMESAVTLPGWSQALIDTLSVNYAEDLAEIAAISGIEFISA